MIDTQVLRERRMRAEQRSHLAREVIETILLTGLIVLVVHFAIQTIWVNTPSMEPTLQSDQNVVVNTLAYVFGAPSRGDVIVLRHHHIPFDARSVSSGCTIDSGTNGQFMTCQVIKRVIGVPGDTIQITPIQVIVDGVVLKEPYIQVPPDVPPNGAVLGPLKLGTDQFIVLGDNRLNSADSRFWQDPVLRQDIVGRVVMVYWPLKSIHWLPNYSSVFEHVKP